MEKELRKYANAKRKESNQWFFKTGKGQYGEGDMFIGVSVPDIRKVAKRFSGAEFSKIEKSLHSKFHEVRLAGVLVLVEKNRAAMKLGDIGEQRKILKLYLKNKKYINSWDIVDLSVAYILGQAILDGLEDEKILDKLSQSKVMWDRRMSIVATWILIREGKFDMTMRIAKKLLGDEEDLMHKAVGWMLREVWKKNPVLVESFLIGNYDNLPRTTLRYSIERMEEFKRKKFLKGIF